MSTSDLQGVRDARPVSGGVPLLELLDVPALRGHRVLAGEAGLERLTTGANVMEVPDILDWVKPHEFLITTAYSLRNDPTQLTDLVVGLARRGLAGLGIKLGRYVERLPQAAIDAADEAGFAVVELPSAAAFSDLLQQVLTRILDHQSAALSGADLLYALVGRRLDDEDEILRRAMALGWRLDRPLRVVVAEPVTGRDPIPWATPTTGPDEVDEGDARVDGRDEGNEGDGIQEGDGTDETVAGLVVPTDGTHGLSARLGRAIRAHDRHAVVVTLGDEAVVLCSATLDDHVLLAALGSGGPPCTAGVSRICLRPTDVAEAYVQARRSATVGERMHGAGTVTRFDDLGSLRLLSHVPDQELEAFLVDVLGPILGDDDTSTALRTTLQGLLEADGNVAETARRLHYHYNTVRARVTRLEELLGPVTTDHRRRLDITLALQILQLDRPGTRSG